MAIPPTAPTTFLFTDIEGSTQQWLRYPQAMDIALARHDDLLHKVIVEHRGLVFKTVGDAFCAVFTAAPDALAAALSAQRLLDAERSSEIGALRVRMALHTGEAQERNGDYFGATLSYVSRLLSAGHGGQVLLSSSTRERVQNSLPAETQLRSLGFHRLDGISRPEHIYRLVAADIPVDFPPLVTFDTARNPLVTTVVQAVRETNSIPEAVYRQPGDETDPTIDVLVPMERAGYFGYLGLAVRPWPEGVPSVEVNDLITTLYRLLEAENTVLNYAAVVVPQPVKMFDEDQGTLVPIGEARARNLVSVHRRAKTASRIQIVPMFLLYHFMSGLREGRANVMY